MKDQRKTEIRVGVTIAVGIIIFIWILTWAKNCSLASKEKMLQVRFDNVSGLEIGDYATVSGVRKGVVDDLQAVDNKVIVVLSLDNDVKLNKDAAFSIAMLDLMGGKKVDIYPGISREPLDFSEVQNGTFTADIPAVMSTLGTVQQDISVLISDMKTSLNAINGYLTDETLNRDIRTTVSNLRSLTSQMNQLIIENRANFNKLASNSAELSEEANNFLKENKEGMKASLEDFKSIMNKTDALVTKVNTFTDQIMNQQNNIGKLVYDKEVFENLQSSLKQLNELSKLILEQLKGDGSKVDADVDMF
jgi:phospholipid/cholesterol/gamma-HCH transport system substrate-binding protein